MQVALRGLGMTVALGVLALATAPGAQARESRFGIEGKFVSYDEARQVFRIEVLSRSAGGFGGSTVGGRAPDDVKPGEVMEFVVKPEGSVLSRTVIRSTEGTGLDRTGTQEGFRAATQAIPRDRPLALSIAPNSAAEGSDAPDYRLLTVIIKLTEEEIRQRLEEILQDDAEAETP